MSRLSTFYDNAMLYKDVTQWMRNRTFATLFIGLLVVAELIAVTVSVIPFNQKADAGVAAYTFLAINDFELEAPEPETVRVILGIADGSLSEDELASWIRSHLTPWVD